MTRELTFSEALALQMKISKLLQEVPEFKENKIGISESHEGSVKTGRWFIVEVTIPHIEGEA